MTYPIWRLEWTAAFRRRRLFVLNVTIPLLLVAPLATGGAPAYHASAAYTVLFVFFGTFGFTIPLLREGDGGTLRRMLLTGVSEASFVAERLIANAVLDSLQLLPATGLILILGGRGPQAWIVAVPALLLGLLAADVVGLWVAGIARSIAEGALFAAVASLFLLHGSGVFRTPVPGSPGAIVEAILPYRPLHEILLAGARGGPIPALGDLLLPAGFLVLSLAASLLLASPLLDRISAPIQ